MWLIGYGLTQFDSLIIINNSMSVSSSTIGGGRTKYKIIFLGDQSVGKSSIIEKYIKDKFQDGLNPTVGIDFHIKNVSRNGQQFRIQLWDTAGQQRFRSLIPNYMKDVNCAVMVYDVSNKASLENLKFWNLMFQEHQTPEAIKICVGNKTDLADRQVTKKQGESHAALYSSKHIQVSAKLGKKVEDLFNTIIDLISDNLEIRNKLPVIDQQGKKETKQAEENDNRFTLNSKKVENGLASEKKKQNCC